MSLYGDFKRVLGQLPPRKITPWIIAHRIISPWMIAHQIIAPRTNTPRTIASEDNCPRGKLPPHHKISPENNCPHSSKFLPKSTTSELKKTALSTSTIIKESFYRRLQLRSKKWFTSIYFLQILTKPCRTPFIREHLSLNAS